LEKTGTLVDPVPHAFSYARDPDDEPWVNLAIAAKARYLVTWDKDLLDLMKENPDGVQFRKSFPNLHVLTPVAFLRELASQTSLPEHGK
jgi:predicted nucleic acid-binding protein